MEYAQQVLIYDMEDMEKFEDLQCVMLKKCLGIQKNVYDNHVIRIVSNKPNLSSRWNAIKEKFVSKCVNSNYDIVKSVISDEKYS